MTKQAGSNEVLENREMYTLEDGREAQWLYMHDSFQVQATWEWVRVENTKYAKWQLEADLLHEVGQFCVSTPDSRVVDYLVNECNVDYRYAFYLVRVVNEQNEAFHKAEAAWERMVGA